MRSRTTSAARAGVRGAQGLVAGRYEVEAELGRGGMGAVVRAFDHTTGRRVALKTLERVQPATISLFEREYRVLATLRHPRVIRVHDYGVLDDEVRYYTMEILAGKDLMELAPVPWRQACRHLRDVATSLALLHARKLLHRDVSPRNVRCDAEGCAKLIDFGALCDFGRQPDIVGTPASMAPEVVLGKPLDQRADLFSLGAVAYWALTGNAAHRARGIADVPRAALSLPPPPSECGADIPRALDQLVLSLLASDPLQRPATAAEVIERLSAIAGLDEDPLAELAQSHLLGSSVVGREREQEKLRKLLRQLEGGKGASILVHGERGSGRSRLLTELALDARVAGLLTLRVDALSEPGPLGWIRSLATGMLDVAPAEARAALPAHLGTLNQVVDDLATRAGLEAPVAMAGAPSAAERRARIQSALASWVLDVAKRRPLLLIVDDVHELDAMSAGCLVRLAHASPHEPLMLVTSRCDGIDLAVAVLELQKFSIAMPLKALDANATDALLDSTFGDAFHRTRLSKWLHDVTRGNPGHTFTLLTELLQRQIVRYQGGAWALPSDLSKVDLPQDLGGLLAQRFAHLDPVAQRLAQLFALHRGGLPSEVCAQVLAGHSTADVARAMAQLVARGLVVQTGSEYRLVDESLRPLLVGPLERERVRELHRALGETLRDRHRDLIARVQAGQAEQLRTEELITALRIGLYLSDGGLPRAGHKVLRDAAITLTVRGDGLTEAIPALKAALRSYQEQGRHRFEIAPLLMPLSLAGTYSDWRLTYRHAQEVVAALCEITGIDRARRWSRWLGPSLALALSIALALVQFHVTARRRMMPAFRFGFLGLMGIGSALFGSYCVLEDHARAKALFERLRPLGWFPAKHPVRLIYGFQRALLENTYGRYAASSKLGRGVLARVRDPSGFSGLPEEARAQLEVGLCLLLGQMDTLRVDGRVHEITDILQSASTSVSRQATAGVKVAYHTHRGERTRCAVYQKELDLLAAQAGATWREDITAARRFWATFMLCEDVMALKQLLRTFEVLVPEAPSLQRVHDAIHAAYLSERGMHAEALAKYEATFEEAVREASTVSLLYAGAYARLLRSCGQPGRALEICDAALQRMQPADVDFEVLAMGARVERGLALIALERLEDASVAARALLDLQRRHDNPFLHGLSHKLAAQVALARDDSVQFAAHLAAMSRWFRRTENPSLMAQSHRLAAEGRVFCGSNGRRGVGAAAPDEDLVHVQNAFERCRTQTEREETALHLVLEASGAETGYLYLCGCDGVTHAAPKMGSPPPAELSERLARIVAGQPENRAYPLAPEREVRPEVDETDTDLLPTYETIRLRCGLNATRTFRVALLEIDGGASRECVGAVALLEDKVPLKLVSPRVLEEIARALVSSDAPTVHAKAESA